MVSKFDLITVDKNFIDCDNNKKTKSQGIASVLKIISFVTIFAFYFSEYFQNVYITKTQFTNSLSTSEISRTDNVSFTIVAKVPQSLRNSTEFVYKPDGDEHDYNFNQTIGNPYLSCSNFSIPNKTANFDYYCVNFVNFKLLVLKSQWNNGGQKTQEEMAEADQIEMTAYYPYFNDSINDFQIKSFNFNNYTYYSVRYIFINRNMDPFINKMQYDTGFVVAIHGYGFGRPKMGDFVIRLDVDPSNYKTVEISNIKIQLVLLKIFSIYTVIQIAILFIFQIPTNFEKDKVIYKNALKNKKFLSKLEKLSEEFNNQSHVVNITEHKSVNRLKRTERSDYLNKLNNLFSFTNYLQIKISFHCCYKKETMKLKEILKHLDEYKSIENYLQTDFDSSTSFFEKIDMFSVPKSLRKDGHSSFKTSFGGLLTIIMYSIYFLIFGLLLNNFLNIDNFTVNVIENSFYESNKNPQEIVIPTMIEVPKDSWDYYIVTLDVDGKNLQINECSNDQILKFVNSTNSSNLYMCYNNLLSPGSVSSLIWAPCDDNSVTPQQRLEAGCKFVNTTNNQTLTLDYNIFMTNYQLDYKNGTNPIVESAHMDNFNRQSSRNLESTKYEFRVPVLIGKFENDNNLLFKQIETTDIFNVGVFTGYAINVGDKILFAYTLFAYSSTDVFQRKILKFTDFWAGFSSILQFLSFIPFLYNFLISDYLYQKFLIKKVNDTKKLPKKMEISTSQMDNFKFFTFGNSIKRRFCTNDEDEKAENEIITSLSFDNALNENSGNVNIEEGSFLKKLDFNSSERFFNFKGQEAYKSKIGGLITIIYYACSLVIFSFYLIQFAASSNLSILTVKDFYEELNNHSLPNKDIYLDISYSTNYYQLQGDKFYTYFLNGIEQYPGNYTNLSCDSNKIFPQNSSNSDICFDLKKTLVGPISPIHSLEFDVVLRQCSEVNFRTNQCQGVYNTINQYFYSLSISTPFSDYNKTDIAYQNFTFLLDNLSLEEFPYKTLLEFYPVYLYYDTGIITTSFSKEPFYFNEFYQFSQEYDPSSFYLLNKFLLNYYIIRRVYITKQKIVDVVGQCLSLILIVRVVLQILHKIFEAYQYQLYLFDIMKNKIKFSEIGTEKILKSALTFKVYIKSKILFFKNKSDVVTYRKIMDLIDENMSIENFVGVKDRELNTGADRGNEIGCVEMINIIK